MAKGGRRRRSEERPDSEFGKALKAYIRRIEGYTQKDLAEESIIAEGTISRIIKGERDPTRDQVRAIIKALHARKALLTLDEANALMLTTHKHGALYPRDADDREIIDLFVSPATEAAQKPLAGQRDVADAAPNVQVSSDNLDEDDDLHDEDNLDEDEILAPDIVLEPLTTPSPAISEPELVSEPEPVLADPVPAPVLPEINPEPASVPDTVIPEPVPVPVPVRPVARAMRWPRWVYASAGLVLLVTVGLILVAVYQNQGLSHQNFTKQIASCANPTTGVTLYTETNYKGQCHTFLPGDYELARYGLEQNVSSIRDWNDGYFVKILDTGKNFYNLDKSMSALPADWDKRADMLHIEKHRPTSCTPGTNGIIAFINTDYSGGCLFITKDIPDLTLSNFDTAIVSIQFVGTYRNTMQLVIYSQMNYRGKCGTYWQNQSDLEQCARLALSVQVLPYTPPTPIPTVPGTHYAGNVAPDA
ncbi:MAG TPA: hypothetical protein DHW02_18400, partial [Ktedonobacter sp.]|nr:hypothetical protein [Ktedonobacter sp.]